MEYLNSFVKNSILMGITISLITFGILYTQINITDEYDEEEKKKELNKQLMTNGIISLLIGVLTWFGIESYNDLYKTASNTPLLEKEMSRGNEHIKNTIENKPLNNVVVDDEIARISNILSRGPAVSETMRGNVFYDLKRDDFKMEDLNRLLEVKNL
jgi:hypothetical protein